MSLSRSVFSTLQWRHNGHDSVSNHQPHQCLLNGLFGRRSKKTWKSRVTGLCAGNSPGNGEFPAWMASNAEKVSIWWRHHENPHKRHPIARFWGRYMGVFCEFKVSYLEFANLFNKFNVWHGYRTFVFYCSNCISSGIQYHDILEHVIAGPTRCSSNSLVDIFVCFSLMISDKKQSMHP